MQITCTAYNGGLVATHPLTTCLARIAVKEHACMRCEQAVKFMMDYRDEIADLKAKYAKRIKAKGVLGTDSNGNHVMGVSATDKPDTITYPLSAFTEDQEWELAVAESMKMGTLTVDQIKKGRDVMKRLADKLSPPPLCPRCNSRPQHPRQKYGQTVWSGACLECLRTTRREAEQAKRAHREWHVTLDFSEEQEFLNILKTHAKRNRRTLSEELMFRLEQGVEK